MFLKKILFTEVSPVIDVGSKRVIQLNDKLNLPNEISAYNSATDEAAIDWSTGKAIYFSLFKYNKQLLFNAVTLQIIGSLFSFSTPILINHFMKGLEVAIWDQAHLNYLLLLALGFGLTSVGNGLSIQHYFHQTLKMNQITNVIINKKLFKHALALSQKDKQKYQVGDIVNYMSSDSETIAESGLCTIDLFNALTLLVGCSSLLFYYIGWSSVVAILVMAALVPLTQKLAKSFIHLEEDMMAQRDTRMTLMTQLLNSIRVVKYFSWEKSVEKEVKDVRLRELAARKKLAKSEILWGLMYSSVSSIVLFVALFTHYLRGQKLDLAIVMTCISIFSIMEHQFGGLSRFISQYMNIFVSGRRISDFLKTEPIQDQQRKIVDSEKIEIKNISYHYSESQKLIENLSFSLKQGQSLAIVGSVGVGKSTLINLLLGEFAPNQGDILIGQKLNKISFVSQEAFIVNSSLKENILFGDDCSTDELNLAIDLACLSSDVRVLPAGLETEIGEKGVNLSGGQKQRVSIARSILKKPETIILDDPLSAVDPHTESLLCDQLIFGYWKNKTRIMATHRLAHLYKFDQVLYLKENGKYELGSFTNLMQSSDDFKEFFNFELKQQQSEITLNQNKQAIEVKNNTAEESRVTIDEDRETGSVKSHVYFTYLKSLGSDVDNGSVNKRYFYIFLLAFGALLSTLAPMSQRAWLSHVSTQNEELKLVAGYGLLGLLTVLVSGVNSFWWTYRGVNAGQIVHDKMLKAVLKTKIRFFDSTPVGRILQRFSRDVESVDFHLQWSFEHVFHSFINILTSFVLIVVALPVSVLFLTPLFYVYYIIQNKYRRVAREIKRLDSLARSPRYAHFKETLQGLTVIRAFDSKNWFHQQFLNKLNLSLEMYYTHYMVNRWFSTRVPLVGASIAMATAFGVVLAKSQGWISAGLAGLVVVYALEFWRSLNWGIRVFSDLESRLTSVERLNFYSELPPEVSGLSDDEFKLKKPYWPQSGKLEFNNVYLKYADHLPDVLKGVGFVVNSGERAGVIGRTGSGKSTLFQSVYRFVDYHQGQIKIDDVEIKLIPLEKLRKTLAVIPQDPSLFLGTLRSNIDRYNESSDEDVWSVLEKVGLKTTVEKLPLQLMAHIAENGSNLSQGQRQLICLARALLMKVKIIFLDEATASVDLETDALIQKVIRESLSGITLITIAHRLATLQGYDKIIELQDGKVVSG